MWQVIYLPRSNDFQLFHLLGPLLPLWDHCSSNCLILVPCPAKNPNKNTSFPWELHTHSTHVGQDGAAEGQIKQEHCSGPGKQTACWVFNVLIITLTTEGKMWKAALSGFGKKGDHLLPRRMLISRFPLRIVHPCNICADVTESMVFVFPSSQILGQGPSQGLQNMLWGKSRILKINSDMQTSKSTDRSELNFGSYFPLKLWQILQARMKAAMLVQDTLACCTPEKLEHCTSSSDWMDPYPQSDSFWKALRSFQSQRHFRQNPVPLQLCIYSNWIVPRNPSSPIYKDSLRVQGGSILIQANLTK